jgi:hypothetical protein
MIQNRQHYSAKPLAEYFQGKPRGAKAEAARAMGLPRQGIITNWIARDHIPGDKLPIVANYLGITVDEYLHRAGAIRAPSSTQPPLSAVEPEWATLEELSEIWLLVPVDAQRYLLGIALAFAKLAKRTAIETIGTRRRRKPVTAQ